MQQIKHFHTYETHIKQRWRNKPLIDVLVSEFRAHSREYYLGAIEHGVITVNHSKVSPTHRLKELDIIRHTVHIHEPVPPKIAVIKKEEDYWVVNKPSGIPCHPTGGYFEYSVTRALFHDQTVGCVNRLDMPVSGVLIVVLRNANFVHNLLGTAEKIYIAKVKGKFPDSVEVDRPIGLIDARAFGITETGKPSRTVFRRLEYKNGHSLVECRPLTGRTHQIRIHSKLLGFPILNDILYGEEYQPREINESENNCDENIEGDEREKYIIKNCKGTNNRSFEICDSFICLHAWKYIFSGNSYEAPWPEWAIL